MNLPETILAKSIEVKAITVEAAIEHPNKEYNAYEWKKTVLRYAKNDDAKFYTRKGQIYNEDVLVTYISDGIRFLQEISYSMMLCSSGFKHGYIKEGKLEIFKIAAGGSIENCENNRKQMRLGIRLDDTLFFTKL